MPAWGPSRFCDFGFSLINVGEDLTRATEIQIAFRCKRQASRCSMQQSDAEPLLKPADEFGDGRWSEAEHGGRTRKTLMLDHLNEGPHIASGVHIRSYIS
jgi:hypothetical protein